MEGRLIFLLVLLLPVTSCFVGPIPATPCQLPMQLIRFLLFQQAKNPFMSLECCQVEISTGNYTIEVQSLKPWAPLNPADAGACTRVSLPCSVGSISFPARRSPNGRQVVIVGGFLCAQLGFTPSRRSRRISNRILLNFLESWRYIKESSLSAVVVLVCGLLTRPAFVSFAGAPTSPSPHAPPT